MGASYPDDMYGPTDHEGWALLGDTNYAGPGFATYATFRTRPQNKWDLAAKMHDLNYKMNGLEVDSRPTIRRWISEQMVEIENAPVWALNEIMSVPANIFDRFFYENQRNTIWHNKEIIKYRKLDPLNDAQNILISKFYKADQIFLIMNEFIGGAPTAATEIWDWGSRQFFLRNRSYFIKNDGFKNPFCLPEVWLALNDSTSYLMIPYSELGRTPPRKADGAPDWDAPTSLDANPGFNRWFEDCYGPVLGRLRAL